jgi:hypothetical protein
MQALLFRFFFAIAFLTLGATLGACSAASAESAGGSDDGGGGTSGTGGSAGATLTLTFQHLQPLELEPSVTQELVVTMTPVSPPQMVHFQLIDGPGTDNGPGSVADAALDATEAMTNAQGQARVRLTAPSIPTTFEVRALIDPVQARLSVVVGAQNSEALTVEAMYAGERTITEWIAEVYFDRTCSDLYGNPPEGPNPDMMVPFPAGDDVFVIEEVPVGRKLAVALRAEHFAGGCSGIDAVVEGQSNSVLVTVTNRPVQLDESDVALRLGLAGREDLLASAMESVIEAARAAALGEADSDTAALLDVMDEAALAGPLGSRFANARVSSRWDIELETALGTEGATSIRDDLGGWLTASVPSLAREDAILGRITAYTTVMDGANLVFETVSGFAARDAGFPASVAATWTADAHDNVSLGATILFNPAAWLVLSAQDSATSDEPDASSVGEALALRGARCDAVTEVLTTHGQRVGESCVGCDVTCTRLLCEQGLELLVNRAANALADEQAELRLAATGAAEVGSQAELRALDGSWVGALDAANRSSELAGDLSAEGAEP